jgi:hypothetical protein
MAAKVFDDILLRGVREGQIPARTQEARDWYRNQAGQMRGVRTDRVIREMGADRYENRFRLGNMYMFGYDPKHKQTLPYYDRFPLVFPINKADGGFLGINFHYLPPVLRAKLMDQLYTITTNKTYNENTRLRASYDLLNGTAKFKEFRPTVKHYLAKQLKTRLTYVAPSEWDIALFLPSPAFVGASKRQVYADSRKIIRGR